MTIDEAIGLFSPITYAVSNKLDGNMSFKWGAQKEVIENREKFLRKNHSSLNDCVIMQLQHEDSILIADENMRGKGAHVPSESVVAEAVITEQKGLVLFLLTADCLPIAYYDPKKKVVALAHLGWKPTEKKLAARVVAKMVAEFGTDPHDLIVLVGPSIHKDSYVVMNPRQKESVDWRAFLEDTPSGETKIDLVAFNRDQLLHAGVLAKNITVDARDTAQSNEFYSHYRSTRTGEPEGRFATIIGLK